MDARGHTGGDRSVVTSGALAAGVAAAAGAAVAWGSADFLGGVASRRSTALEVVALSRLAGVVVLAGLAGVTRDPLPPWHSLLWASAAGVSGAVGIAALYRGLAAEGAAVVAPMSGVLGAAFPVLFAGLAHGVLPAPQQAGLVLALVGIWLVSTGHASDAGGILRSVLPGTVAGLGFGGYFILLAQVGSGALFTPLVAAVGMGFLLATVAVAVTCSGLPRLPRNPLALGAGVLDAIGAVGYLAAIRWVRVDVAAVLASLYPAVTVLWFWRAAHESVSRSQWAGLGVCLVAIALIVL